MLNITVNSPHFVGHTCEITPLPATMDDPSQKILKQWKNINLLNSESNSLLTQGLRDSTCTYNIKYSTCNRMHISGYLNVNFCLPQLMALL